VDNLVSFLPHFVRVVIKTVLALYIVVNPAGVSSVFGGLTRSMSAGQRRGIALRAVIGGAVILAAFALAGTYLFQLFHITGAALQIAGGIIVFGVAFALARGKEREFFGIPEDAALGQSPKSLAYSPLAVPLIAGPASITVVMTLSAEATTVDTRIALMAAIAAVPLLCLLSMLRWLKLSERRGPGMDLVAPRIMGLVLAVIAVQFIIEGIIQVLPRFAAAVH